MPDNLMRAIHNFIASNGAILPPLGSRAGSVQEPKDDARVTEVINGLIVTRPAKKITNISNPVQEQRESEPEVIDLQEYAKSKAGSVTSSGINKLREIVEFMNASNY